MRSRGLMFMGTGSDVGKSLIVAGLCRLLNNRGLSVRPFKPQNMSNNAAVTADGGEIGRAQALQAQAARVPASVHMNPILLKPESGTGAQIIVQGRRRATLSARQYFAERPRYMPAILDSFRRLSEGADFILVEGAGSPGEINLRSGDLANLGFAEAANLPAILIGDIERGGVIASIIGTLRIIGQSDRNRIKGFIINKFRGDPDLFSEARNYLEKDTATHCFGVVPFLSEATRLPAEDTVALETQAAGRSGTIRISVLRLPRIANFDDLDPLRLEPSVNLDFVASGDAIPGDTDLVVIPGSKSTMADLAALRAEGWDIDLAAHVRRGGHVIGLCGGYQMLGRKIHDPGGLEGRPGSVAGLGYLDVETELKPDKTLTEVEARHEATGLPLKGYEIHLGETNGPDCGRPFAHVGERPDGARSRDGRIAGTYLHGCFASDSFRRAFLSGLGATGGGLNYEQAVDDTLEALARHLDNHLDIDRLLAEAAFL